MKPDRFTIPEPTPEQIAFEKRAKDISGGPESQAMLGVIEELLKEVETMTIAKRFRTDVKIGSIITWNQGEAVNHLYENLSEAEYKRKQLELDIESVKGKLVAALASLQTVILDIDATKID